MEKSENKSFAHKVGCKEKSVEFLSLTHKDLAGNLQIRKVRYCAGCDIGVVARPNQQISEYRDEGAQLEKTADEVEM